MDHMTVSVFVAGKIILVVHKTVYYFLHNSPARYLSGSHKSKLLLGTTYF